MGTPYENQPRWFAKPPIHVVGVLTLPREPNPMVRSRRTALHRIQIGDSHATHCDSINAGCFPQRQHRSASSTNEGLQIMPRVSAGLPEKSYAGCLQQ